jgi:hypothetical protein
MKVYYVDAENSLGSGVWNGYPQFYEFDFLRVNDGSQHFTFQSKSAYTYNWSYYITYPYNNNYTKKLVCTNLNNVNYTWLAQDGIPFVIKNITMNGDRLISFECISPHGLQPAESVELSFGYNNKNIFEVYSVGNDNYGSETNVFNIYNFGYTGNTFLDRTNGTFKRIINSDNIVETKSKYYIREHKVLVGVNDIIMTKSGFEKNPFNEERQLELSSITPNKITRISQKVSGNSYLATLKKDIDLNDIVDNQKRPISQLFLSIINKGYSGYFNDPVNGIGLKQGWDFNVMPKNNAWWAPINSDSNTNITTSSYVKTDISGNTKTFYYNNDLNVGDVIDGDFCEWNDYEQTERVISSCNQKITYNQNVFQTSTSTNPDGFYYKPHNSMTVRVFSDYVETGNISNVDQVPFYSFYSESDQEFRWRDLYGYGFIDELGLGVDYPYLNNSHYPYQSVIFKLSPEGINANSYITGTTTPVKPIIDGCE